MLKPFIGGGGYLRVGLKVPEDTKVYKVMLSRKVAEAFVINENPELFDIVGHKDDIRTNNVYTNLYWTTQSENIQKAVESGRLNFSGASNANSVLVVIFNDDMTDVKEFKSLSEVLKYLGCSVGAVSYAKNSGGKCSGYRVANADDKVIDTPKAIESDTEINSCVGLTPVILVNIETGEEIWCNSINLAAKKLGRFSLSVSEAAEFGRVCNGYKVVYDIK